MLFMSCVCHAFASIHCCLVVTCWERIDLLTLVSDVYCIFATFSCGILGQVWYLIVSFPDLCRLSYFVKCVSFTSFEDNYYILHTYSLRCEDIINGSDCCFGII